MQHHFHFHLHHHARHHARYDVDMTQGSTTRHLINFALPLLAGNLFQQLYNMVDTWVVGNFVSNEAFSAVGTVTPIINTLIGFFLGMSSGAGVVISQYYGAHRPEKVHEAVHTAMLLTIVMGVVFTGVGIAMTPLMLELMKTPKDVLPLSSLYLRIYFLGIPGTIMHNFGAALLRAFGDTKRPMLFLTVSGIVNACLNLFFVIVCGMSVDGVATATVISQYISLFLVVRCLRRSEGLSHLELKNIRLNREESLRMIQIGLPAGLQSTLFSIANVLVQSSVNSFGASVVAANPAAASIEGFVRSLIATTS